MLSGAEMLCHYESLITFPTHSRHSQVIYDMNFLNYCKTKKNKTLHSLKARVSSDFDDSDNEQQQKWINEIKSDSHSLPGATRFTKSMMLFYPYKEALLFFFFFFFFLQPHLLHIEVPSLGVKSELQLLAYATATVTLDLSYICNLRFSLWQCWINIPPGNQGSNTLPHGHYVAFLTYWATRGTPQSPSSFSRTFK